jgi:predicted transcriptional regulator
MVPDNNLLMRLFGSNSRTKILALLFSRPHQSFYQREIIFEAGLSLQAGQRELGNLVNAGIVKKLETRKKVYYEADARSPFFKPLMNIFGTYDPLSGNTIADSILALSPRKS